jgi:hypothetical protein
MTSYGKGRSLCLKVCLLIKISWFKKYLVPCITLHIRSIDFLPLFFWLLCFYMVLHFIGLVLILYFVWCLKFYCNRFKCSFFSFMHYKLGFVSNLCFIMSILIVRIIKLLHPTNLSRKFNCTGGSIFAFFPFFFWFLIKIEAFWKWKKHFSLLMDYQLKNHGYWGVNPGSYFSF